VFNNKKEDGDAEGEFAMLCLPRDDRSRYEYVPYTRTTPESLGTKDCNFKLNNA